MFLDYNFMNFYNSTDNWTSLWFYGWQLLIRPICNFVNKFFVYLTKNIRVLVNSFTCNCTIVIKRALHLKPLRKLENSINSKSIVFNNLFYSFCTGKTFFIKTYYLYKFLHNNINFIWSSLVSGLLWKITVIIFLFQRL